MADDLFLEAIDFKSAKQTSSQKSIYNYQNQDKPKFEDSNVDFQPQYEVPMAILWLIQVWLIFHLLTLYRNN